MSESGIAEIVRITIFNHPPECVFAPNAVENIIAKWRVSNLSGDQSYSPALLYFLEDAIMAEEIYCPHEGIDRRSEYYDGINLAGWSEWANIAHEMV
jgi:hypothetical protein